PAPTHGHHPASAVLAVEAFRLAGDPAAFPEQLRELKPWQARRIVQNVGRGPNANPGQGVAIAGWPADVPDGPGVVKIDVGVRDPVTGESFASIAARSRGMHKTQGFGINDPPVNEGPRVEPFVLLDGESPTKGLMDGVDTTWNRVPGGAEIARSTEEEIAKFDAQDVPARLRALLAIRRRLAALPTDPLVSDKRDQLDRIIRACLGLEVDTVVDRPEVVPGETVKLRHTATVHAPFPVRWTAVRYPGVPRRIGEAAQPASESPRRARGFPGRARRHAAHPALLAAHGGDGRAVRRGRSVAHRPPRESARVPHRVCLRRRRTDAGDRGGADVRRGSHSPRPAPP